MTAFKYYLDEGLDRPEPIFADAIGSDVSGQTLLSRGVALPLFPDYLTWRKLVNSKQRCGRCWRFVRNHADLVRHNELFHPNAPLHFPAGSRSTTFRVVDPFSLAVVVWLLVYAGFGSVAAGRAANESVKFRPITPPSALEIAHGWRADFYQTHEFINGRWMPKAVRP